MGLEWIRLELPQPYPLVGLQPYFPFLVLFLQPFSPNSKNMLFCLQRWKTGGPVLISKTRRNYDWPSAQAKLSGTQTRWLVISICASTDQNMMTAFRFKKHTLSSTNRWNDSHSRMKAVLEFQKTEADLTKVGLFFFFFEGRLKARRDEAVRLWGLFMSLLYLPMKNRDFYVFHFQYIQLFVSIIAFVMLHCVSATTKGLLLYQRWKVKMKIQPDELKPADLFCEVEFFFFLKTCKTVA